MTRLNTHSLGGYQTILRHNKLQDNFIKAMEYLSSNADKEPLEIMQGLANIVADELLVNNKKNQLSFCYKVTANDNLTNLQHFVDLLEGIGVKCEIDELNAVASVPQIDVLDLKRRLISDKDVSATVSQFDKDRRDANTPKWRDKMRSDLESLRDGIGRTLES